MIELLILFALYDKVLTMYGISKEIKNFFSVLTTPSYGTIKPALRRLESDGYVKCQKTISKGGRPSTYYSITKTGVEELKSLILQPPLENPIQFLTSSRIKLCCSELLDKDEMVKLLRQLKVKAESIYVDAQKLLKKEDFNLCSKMVFENLTCEYKNFIIMLEGFENACRN